MLPADAISGIPELAGLDAGSIAWRSLGGLTNHNYRLTGNGFDYILRIPRQETNRWIDRRVERHNLQRAVAAGLAPAFRYFDVSGVMLSDNLAGAEELTPTHLHDPAVSGLVMETVKRLHQLRPGFEGQVDLAALLERYYYLMSEFDRLDLEDEYQQVMALIKEPHRDDSHRVPSHNDLVLQNLLMLRGRIWLIDWEYSSTASPYWDLATLCNEAGFDDQQAFEFIGKYAGTKVESQAQQLHRYRRLLGFLSDCWVRAFH